MTGDVVVLDAGLAEQARDLIAEVVRIRGAGPTTPEAILADRLSDALRGAQPPHYCHDEWYG